MHVVVTEFKLASGRAKDFVDFYRDKVVPWYQKNSKVERIDILSDHSSDAAVSHRFYKSKDDAASPRPGDAEYEQLKSEAKKMAASEPVRREMSAHSF